MIAVTALSRRPASPARRGGGHAGDGGSGGAGADRGLRRGAAGLRALVLLLLALAAGPVLAAPPPRPKLVVAISVDQFAAALYDRYRPSFTGGLRRLGSGIAFTGWQSHAATETCPGHSTLLTGRHPAGTGIVANDWLDPATGKPVYCVSVPGAPADARGPQNMAVPTLGDWMKAATPASRVVAVSGKDRAAITMAGHHADAVYWWEDGKGFVTSAYAGPAGADVTGPAEAFDRARLDAWAKAPPALWPALPARCAPLAHPTRFGDIERTGAVPPPPLSPDLKDQLRASPLFDSLVLDFAGETIGRLHLGHGPVTDLLAVSLSATDYVGHRYGNGGPEMCAHLAALDRALGAFLVRLDRLRVPYVVVLAADHGGSDAAERRGGQRIDTAALLKALNADLRTRFALAADPVRYQEAQALTVQGDAGVRDAAVAWLRARPEVAAVFPTAEIAAVPDPSGTAPSRLTLLQRERESYFAGRSGDVAVVYREGATLGWPRKPADNVAGHGSPWDYDRRVPILFWWRGAPARRPATEAETVDIAPTLAAIAQVPVPKLDGRCLRQVTGRCP